MNEQKLRSAIRKELKSLNESDAATQVMSGFNAAAANPADIVIALNVIGSLLVGTAFLKMWSPVRAFIESKFLSDKGEIHENYCCGSNSARL